MSSTAKRVLGRGLADLIPVGGSGDGNAGHEDAQTHEAPVSALHANPKQPRTNFDDDALSELSDSIRVNGILQPILVRPRVRGGYEIVAGERRYRAALRAGLRTVPIIVRSLNDEQTLALALIENLIREDLRPLEAARAFHRLMQEFGWTQEEMGQRVGKSRSAIANSLRLLSLPEPILSSIERGELSESHARTLIGDERQRHEPAFSERQIQTWRQIVENDLSVRDAERLMRSGKAQPTSNPDGIRNIPDGSGSTKGTADSDNRPANISADFLALEDRLRGALGTRVKLVGGFERGRLEISYFSPEELDDLVTRLEARFGVK